MSIQDATLRCFLCYLFKHTKHIAPPRYLSLVGLVNTLFAVMSVVVFKSLADIILSFVFRYAFRNKALYSFAFEYKLVLLVLSSHIIEEITSAVSLLVSAKRCIFSACAIEGVTPVSFISFNINFCIS